MHSDFYHTPGKHRGIFAWILSTDHKRIGLLYLVSIFSFWSLGVLLALTMRFELIAPAGRSWTPRRTTPSSRSTA